MENLESEIVALYTRSGFGKTLKAEIDALLFHHLLLACKPLVENGIVKDGKIDYFRVNKSHIHALSRNLRTTEAVVTRLLENDYLTRSAPAADAEQTALRSILRDMITSTPPKKDDLKTGKVRFTVANPIVKKILQTALFNNGGIADSSFNHDILSIDLYDFLRLLDVPDESLQSRLRELFYNKAAAAQLSAEDRKKLQELEQKPLPEQIRAVITGGLAKLLGKALGEEGGNAALDIAERLFDFGKTFLLKGKQRGD